MTASSLRARFADALELAGATSDGSAVFDELAARYGEAHRHYHTLEHIDACLGWLDWCSGLADRREQVALALWFHDAVYDPRNQGNERRSAELATSRLRELGVPVDATERIAAHILATESHAADCGDSRLVVDLDLTILGATPAEFDDFEQRIQREYSHVPPAVFATGRRAILERFLERPILYAVSALREELEIVARANLARRIAELSKR